jgi:histidinol dehydrogenase
MKPTLKTITISPGGEAEFAATLAKRKSEASAEVKAEAEAIVDGVRQRGYDAVREYSLKPAPFDNAEPYEVGKAQIDKLAAACPAELYSILEEATSNISNYQSRLKRKSIVWQTPDGSTLGQLIRPLERVGIYVPGGTAAYPSSLLMCAVPAKVAGVEEIVLCTPPTQNLNAAVFAAAKIAGVDRVFALGGVQAIAAMAFGVSGATLNVPKVDKIIGPGNAYVTAAKRAVFGDVDLDMIAGPSEIFIIADDSADPAFVAADLLSQAEHDKLAAAILATDNEAFANAVITELEHQLATLPRREIAEVSLNNHGAICVCANIASCIALSNAVAPEHLELLTSDPMSLLDDVRHAGAIFAGAYSPEPLGDYFAGPSHILPTSGAARYFSPLSFESFTKRTSLISASKKSIEQSAAKIAAFARAEGFEAHARSAELRK